MQSIINWDHVYTQPQSTDTEVNLPDPNIEKLEDKNIDEPQIKLEIESEDDDSKDPLENESTTEREADGIGPPKNLECTSCYKKFKYYWAYKTHMRKVHATIEDLIEIQCLFCTKKFQNQQMLAFHIEIEQALHKQLSKKVQIQCSRCDAKVSRFFLEN